MRTEQKFMNMNFSSAATLTFHPIPWSRLSVDALRYELINYSLQEYKCGMDEETCPQTTKQQQKNTSFIGLAKRAGEPSKKKKNASDCDTFIHREKKDMTMTMPKERRRKIECE